MGLNINLAAVLGFCLLASGWLPPLARALSPESAAQQTPAATDSNSPTQQNQSSGSPAEPQAPPAQNSDSSPPQPSSTSQTPNSAGQAKPSAKPRHHSKKTIYPDCLNPPTALNPTIGNSTDSGKSTSAGSGSTNAGSTNTGSAKTGTVDGSSTNGSAKPSPAPLKPCPPPKKVVRNGGSNEPAIQIVGGTTAEQAADQHSTEQLTAATEDNLKKIAGRQLNPSQQETVSQIKQFLEQSKQAVASGDPERGHNLAMKARLLSDELAKL